MVETLEKNKELTYDELIKMPEVIEAFEIIKKLPENFTYHNLKHTNDVMREAVSFAVANNENDVVIKLQAIAAAWHDTGFSVDPKNHEQESVNLFKNSDTYKNLSDDDRAEIVNTILGTRISFMTPTEILEEKIKNEKDLRKRGVFDEELSDLKLKISKEKITEIKEPALVKTGGKYNYVLDADVSNFGRSDFSYIFDRLFEENHFKEVSKKRAENPDASIQVCDVLPAEYIKSLDFVLKLINNHSWKTESAKSKREINVRDSVMWIIATKTELEKKYKIAA